MGNIMSEDHGHTDPATNDTHPEPHYTGRAEHHEPQAPAPSSEPWAMRALFGFAGLILLGGAYVAWQFKGMLGGEVGQALPWLIAAAVLLGAGALIESISTLVWVSLIAGVFAIAVTFIVTGRVTTYPSVGQSIFVVDRFSGEVELCNAQACTVLPRNGYFLPQPSLPHVSVPRAMRAN
jgi:hypothetical protein